MTESTPTNADQPPAQRSSPDYHKHHSRGRHHSHSPDHHRHSHSHSHKSSKHSRHRSRSPSKHSKHKRKSSKSHKHHRYHRRHSSSDSDSDSYSSDDHHHHHQRKHKKHSRHRKHRSRSPDDKDRLLAELERKSRQRSQYNLNDSYGQHGVLDPQLDQNSKTSEFTAWLLDTHGVVMETLSKHDRKKMFADYAEAYNTGTLSSQKYIDYDAHTKQSATNNANVHDPHNRVDDVTVPMSDEERLRAERLQLHASLKQKMEQQRIDAVKQALLQTKQSNPEYYAQLNAETQASKTHTPATFESIAKERERQKREAERKQKYG